MDSERKRVVLAGGAGFIGSHLTDLLVNEGYHVVVLDNFVTGRRRNITAPTSDITLIEHDVTKPLSEEQRSVIGSVDGVYHLASPASPKDFRELSEDIAYANSLGAIELLNLAKVQGARYVFASTSEVYGDPLEHPQEERYWGNVNPVGPRSCYDESKRFGEMIAMTFLRTYRIDVRVARIFNTYGPRMRPDDGRVVSNFINQAIRNEPISVYGDGSQTRSFCYVSDMVRGLYRLFREEGARGEVVNIGNPSEFTVKELAEQVIALTGSSSEIVYRDLPVDDPTRRRPVIDKARQILRWQPEIDLRDGLRETITYYRTEMSGSDTD